jgi:hypothetical protein
MTSSWATAVTAKDDTTIDKTSNKGVHLASAFTASIPLKLVVTKNPVYAIIIKVLSFAYRAQQ